MPTATTWYRTDWANINTIEALVQNYPDRIRTLLRGLDLNRPSLKPVKEAWQKRDLEGACEGLLAYYRSSDTTSWLRGQQHEVSPQIRETADNAVNDRFEQQGTVDKVPREEDGHLDWTYQGPINDLQFAVFLNRHQYFPHLVTMWQATRERRYAAAVDRLVKDWVIKHGQNPQKPEPHAVWTPLNPGIRMSKPWPRVFFGLQQADDFTPAARLLLLSTIPEHANFLQEHLRPKHNFATMQMNGLGTLGAAFPEFAEAEAWRHFAIEQVLDEFEDQLYPDGVQKELSASYHWVSLKNFEGLAENLQAAGYELPEAYRKNLARMYDYLADIMRPNGALPLNNDSSLWHMSSKLLDAAEEFQRPDWRFVATCGEEGTQPATPPSRFFPWAGQLISRSGWGRQSHWSFFDVGPYGVSHQHNDALHLSVTAFGRDVLVDSGRFAYQGEIAEKFRKPYAMHSRGHNVVLVDGMGQQATQTETEAPHHWYSISEQHDIAIGAFRNGYHAVPANAVSAWNGVSQNELEAEQPGMHCRAVLYVRDRGWIIFDHMQVRGEHTLTPLWHFHPDCQVTNAADTVMSTDPDQGNIRITPAGPLEWDLQLVKGQESPTLQGWYSRKYGEVEPATCAVYEAPAQDSATFAWVMTPAKGIPPPVQIHWLEAPLKAARLQVTWPDNVTTYAVVAFEPEVGVEIGKNQTLAGGAYIQTGDSKEEVVGGRILDAKNCK